jgi:GDPmannose 4,6-dehydratase
MKILIIGGSGQFGYYFCKIFLKKDYKIYLTTRNIKNTKLKKIRNLSKKISIFKLNVLNPKQVRRSLLSIQPNYILYLAGQSSPAKSFILKKETLSSNFLGCKNFLKLIKKFNLKTKFFYASSSEIFGNINRKVNIYTIKKPVSPYGVSKLKAFNLVKKYREKFYLPFYNGIIFNTESPLRPKNFLIPKICLSAIKAKISKKKILFKFGNINVKRDWGWCEEYVLIIWKILQKEPKDFMIATGKTYSVKFLLNIAFSYFNLNWRDYVIVDKSLFREREINCVAANIYHLKNIIKFLPKINGIDIIKKLLLFYQK